MSNLISSEAMHEVMEWAYDKSINGVGFGTAVEMAEDYLSESGNLRDKIDSLIRWQNTKAGLAGFVSGLGGVATLPVALPANIASTLYIQIRMIAAIAYMTGYDIRNDKVKTMVYLCLFGNGAGEVLKDFGVTTSIKFAENFIKKKVTKQMLNKINKYFGFRLVTKAGLTKLVPILGGVVSGTFDAATTNLVGNTARDLFLNKNNQNFDGFHGNIYDENGQRVR